MTPLLTTSFISLGIAIERLGPEDVRLPYHESTKRNGEHLSELLTENNLAVNTCFRKRIGKRWTFEDCDPLEKRQPDYIYWEERSGETVSWMQKRTAYSKAWDQIIEWWAWRFVKAYESPSTWQSDLSITGSCLRLVKTPSVIQHCIRNQFQFLEDEEYKDPSKRYQEFIAANEIAA